MLNLFFPKSCQGCGGKLLDTEVVICTVCRNQLPLACFHRTNSLVMKQFFFGRLPIENATALLQFQKRNITQHLLHQLKYRRQEQIGDFLGVWLGTELSKKEEYKNVDMVIPVPLHKKKERQRGYNQLTKFGEAIAAHLKIPYRADVLLKENTTQSQVFKGRLGRFGNTSVFTLVQPEAIKGKHLLLVDDLVTTGATLEKCGNELIVSNDVKLSLATMAIAL